MLIYMYTLAMGYLATGEIFENTIEAFWFII